MPNFPSVHFFQPFVEYLGHVVGGGTIKADPKKLKVVHDWPTPTNVGELRSFLGLCNYFRQYVRRYAHIAKPLHDLTSKVAAANWSKDRKLWTHDCQHAFEQLKVALTTAPVLVAPDYTKRFLVFTDASIHATGAILAQEYPDGIHPIAFYSRKLKPAEVKYPTHEQELLAVVCALKEWHCYLEGSPFTAVVRTDHKPLQHFFEQKNMSRRQARWWELLHTYDFTIEYVHGPENPADSLSRYPLFCNSVTSDVCRQLAAITLDLNTSFIDKVKAATLVDPWFTEANIAKLKLTHHDGLFHTRAGQLVIPNDSEIKMHILAEAHDSKLAGHRGVHATTKSLALSFWWPCMLHDVKNYVTSCLQCQRNKSNRIQDPPAPKPLPVPTGQFHSISMDFMTDLPLSNGFDSIFVIIDRLTKMVLAFPCHKTITALELAKLFMHKVVLQGFGLPRSIISDRGSVFMSEFWQELLRLMNTRHKPSTAYHPQTDGQTEVYNRVIQEVLRNYVSPLHDDWSDLLPFATFAINNTVHSVTKHTPFFLHQGFHPRTPLNWHNPEPINVPSLSQWFDKQRQCLQLVQNLIAEANARTISKSNNSFTPFAVGDMVLLNTKNLKFKHGTKKFHPRFCGPFKVTRVIRDVAFELELPKEMKRIHNVFHGSLLKPFISNDRHDTPPPPLILDDEEFFLVDAILAHRIRRRTWRKNAKGRKTSIGKLKYDVLVKWQGYGSEYNSWVKEEDCTESLVSEYWQSIGGRPD